MPGLPGKTWLDLLRQFLPTIRPAPPPLGGALVKYGDELPRLRPIAGETFDDNCRNPLSIDAIETEQAVIADKPRLLVAPTNDEGCLQFVALFAGDGDGKLLDVADFKQDAHTFFGDKFVRRLGPAGQLVTAENTHESSGGGYQIYTLAVATADKLVYVDSTFTHNEVDCRQDIWRVATIRLILEKSPMAAIAGDIETTVKHKAADCETPQGRDRVTHSRTLWRWDSAKQTYRETPR